MKSQMRELLGKAVREEWVKWASEQPDAKPSWLVPWEQLNERDQEVDRRLGEAAVRTLLQPIVSAYRNMDTNEVARGNLRVTYSIMVEVLIRTLYEEQEPDYQEVMSLIWQQAEEESEQHM